MDNQMLKTIPLEVAMEYYKDAARRSRRAGTVLERKRIEELLRKKGMYDALLVIKSADQK